jgi:putative addiction module killer protein
VEVQATKEFDTWYKKCPLKDQAQIDARVARIESFGHFGDAKSLKDGLAELRWKNGRRVYFARVGE